jgi:hypothetical protein
MIWAQEKLEAPVWNLGDQWRYRGKGGDKFDQKVIGVGNDIYIVQYGKETRGYDKSTMNLNFIIEGDKRLKFTGTRSKVLDFPLFVGKKWHKLITATSRAGRSEDYREEYLVASQEDVNVEAGKFKAFKIEYRSIRTRDLRETARGAYWYSPEVKTIIKRIEEISIATGDLELISYQMK